MTARHAATVVLAALTACVSPAQLKADVNAAAQLVEQARKVHAARCAPEPFANAEAEVSFARVELDQGNARRAWDHATAALASARQAWDASRTCGNADADADGIADVVDKCPYQAEDLDGDRDDDGCRDLDPYGDADRDGIRNIDDDCVDVPEDEDGDNDEDGCPETSEDTDGDGIIDVTDACPDEAEDPDGFEDQDGCPDNDNDNDGVHDLDDNCPNNRGTPENAGCPSADRDRDGVADVNDECPNEAETQNGYLDDDGCPDQASVRVKVERDRIELVEPVTFTGVTADLAPDSKPVLDDVARALAEMPVVQLRIEGHTDAQGDEGANLILSRRQAEAVLEYLVSRGVNRGRLEAQGFGGTRPIDTNRTESGRARNRRIELVLLR